MTQPTLTDDLLNRAVGAASRVKLDQYLRMNPHAGGMPGSGWGDAMYREQIKAALEAVLEVLR